MRRNNKFLSLVIALSVILALLSACDTSQPTNEPIKQNVSTIEQQQSIPLNTPDTSIKESEVKEETNISNTDSIIKKDSSTSNYSTTTHQTNSDSYSDTAQIKDTQDNTEKKETIVYVTRTGAKYHRDGCRYLSRSQIPMNLSDAKASGYDSCSVCNPPE